MSASKMLPLFHGPHHRHRIIIIIVIIIIKAACKRSLLSGGSVSWHSFSLILGPTFCSEIQAAVRIDFSKLKNGEDCFVIRHTMCPWFASSIHAERTTTIPPSTVPEQTFHMATIFHTKATKRLSSPTLWSWWYLSNFPKQAFKSHQIRSHPIIVNHQAFKSALPPTALATTPPNSLVVAVPQKTPPNIPIHWSRSWPNSWASICLAQKAHFLSWLSLSWLWPVKSLSVFSTHDPLWELFCNLCYVSNIFLYMNDKSNKKSNANRYSPILSYFRLVLLLTCRAEERKLGTKNFVFRLTFSITTPYYMYIAQ